MNPLELLIGTWRGKGTGEYPSIAPFSYIEEIKFQDNGFRDVIQYEQRTWLDEARTSPSHWETGLIRLLGEHEIEIINAQIGRRVEVLVGDIELKGPQHFVIDLNSITIANDVRMVGTQRHIEISGNQLFYTMSMAMTKVPTTTHHLQATLVRGLECGSLETPSSDLFETYDS
ncbi:MAG: FABP family protein [Chloroflexi bacterium]|nr:FABP family protein [Chloroflexota bacterium]